ncbi:MAG: fumarylacetoacetase [Bacteroidetes bacterium RIFCSPLOWO2_12_FULL_35_15]|nr:MAG: fumarylacetoacetase [Bacteroidetes bacterium RIFCSPLOWO2_12_FULL_35_15]
MIKANDPSLKSWIEVDPKSDFPIQNLPFGIFKTQSSSPRIGVAIGDQVLDLAILNKLGFFNNLHIDNSVFTNQYLNDFIALGNNTCRNVRQRISDLLNADHAELRDNKEAQAKALQYISNVQMQLPVKIGDYTDFYSSMDHAINIGTMIRDPKNALLSNWKHLPVGYHGRASSIIVSGTNFHRPKGQTLPADQAGKPANEVQPVFGPSKLLDFELETAFIIGKETQLGDSITTANADDHIFGMVLFNDWSARDIQTWEYVPLGPFLSKNFASTISPWIVTLDALEPFRVEGYKQDPKVLPYLQYEGNKNIDINLEVFIQPENGEETIVSHSNYKFMYWNMEQQLAHHTVNGCNMNIGDMLASGTISGPTPESFGSMMEITWRGTKPLKLKDGSERKFINDNDTVIIRGYSEKDGVRIGFGECKAMVLPAKS